MLYFYRSGTLFIGKEGEVFILSEKAAVLNNLILFEGDNLARKICVLNDWNSEELTVYTLELGLRNRELDVVQRALASISVSMEILIACIITKFIVENNFIKGSDFRSRIIKMALEYVSNLIERRVKEGGQSDAENILLLHSSVEQVILFFLTYL